VNKKQCTYKVTLQHFRVSPAAMEKQQCFQRVLLLDVTVNNIKIFSVAQKWFHGRRWQYNLLWSSCTMSYTLTDFNQIWISLTKFHESCQYQNTTEICPVGVALIHAHRRTARQNEGQNGRTWQSKQVPFAT